MFYLNAKEFLNTVCKEIRYEPANKPVSEELQGHIEDIKEEYLCKGYSEKEAEEKAVEQMGDAKQIGKKLNKMYGPKLDWMLLVLICILIFFGILGAATYFNTMNRYIEGSVFTGTMFIRYILALGMGTILSGLIYFMDYKKLCKHSLLIYMIGIILNIFCFISDDADIEILYAILPFYGISFAGFINQINHKKRNIVKTIVLSIIPIILLRRGPGGLEGFLVITYLLIITSKLLKLKRNKIKYIAILWVIPILILGIHTYEMRMFRLETEAMGPSGWQNAKNQLINSAEVLGTVNDPRRNWNDMTPYDFINSDYEFLSFLAQYGWIPSIIMLIACILLSVKLIINVKNIKDSYGKLIIIAITSIYILQIISNFRMSFSSIGILTDAPIPLVSFGTIGLIVNMMCMALVLSVYRTKNLNFEVNQEII